LIRRQGFSPVDAADLAQDFFVHLLEHEALGGVAREKGKFRSFLQKSLANFLNNQRDRANARKRGGNRTLISIDAEIEEGRHPVEPADTSDPARLFDRRWALAVIDEVTAKLKQRNSEGERGAVFAELQPYLTGDTTEGTYAALAARLNMTDGAVKVALHRLRREFGELVRSEVRHTLVEPTDQDFKDEIRHLFAALAE
jgi:RNA polymerase sigma-70 factor (ECF subfamily)